MSALARILRWRCRLVLGLPLLAFAPAHANHGVEAPELKAAIVYSILQFVEWPAETDSARGSVLSLCVDANGPLAGFFKALAGRAVQKRQLEVNDVAEGQDGWKNCHAVFLDGASPRVNALAARLPRSLPLLVMTDLEGQPDTMVQLMETGGRMSFNVDLGAARRARLQVSSRLLKLAKKVNE